MKAADDGRHGLVAGGRGGPEGQLLNDGQEEVFAREELDTGRVEHHVGEEPNASGASGSGQAGNVDGDWAERNRGLGQERVGEAGPGPDQRPLDPAASSPGTGGSGPGGSSSATPSSEDAHARTPR